MEVIISATKGRSGLHSSSIKVFTPEQFFNHDRTPRQVELEYYYIQQIGAHTRTTLLTKKLIEQKYSEYRHTKTYQHITGDRWRR